MQSIKAKLPKETRWVALENWFEKQRLSVTVCKFVGYIYIHPSVDKVKNKKRVMTSYAELGNFDAVMGMLSRVWIKLTDLAPVVKTCHSTAPFRIPCSFILRSSIESSAHACPCILLRLSFVLIYWRLLGTPGVSQTDWNDDIFGSQTKR